MQTVTTDSFDWSVYTRINPNYSYQSLTEDNRKNTVKAFVLAQIENIRNRHENLRVDPVRDVHLIAPLNRLLLELKALHDICRQSEDLSEPQKYVNQLARRIIRKINAVAIPCYPRMNDTELQTMVNWGLSERVNDDLLYLTVRDNKPLPIIQRLVKNGADIHRPAEGFRNILKFAATNSDPEIVKYFLSLGLNPRTRNELGLTAASFAIPPFRPLSLPPLPQNTVSVFDTESIFYSHFSHLNVLLIFMLYAMYLSTICELPFSNDLAKNLPILHVNLLVPSNTALRQIEETKISMRELYLHGCTALSYAMHNMMSSNTEFCIAFLIATCSIMHYLERKHFDPKFFGTINYITQIAKIANVVSVVTLFYPNRPLDALGTVSLYALSELDNYGYLPALPQKFYYSALRTISNEVDRVSRVAYDFLRRWVS